MYKQVLKKIFLSVLVGCIFLPSLINPFTSYTKDNFYITVTDGPKEWSGRVMLSCPWTTFYFGFHDEKGLTVRDFLNNGYRPIMISVKNKNKQSIRITARSMQSIRAKTISIKNIEDLFCKSILKTVTAGFLMGVLGWLYTVAHSGVQFRDGSTYLYMAAGAGCIGSFLLSYQRVDYNVRLANELNRYISWQYNLYFRQLKPDESVEWLFVFPKNLKIDTITIPIYDMNNNIITNLEIPISF